MRNKTRNKNAYSFGSFLERRDINLARDIEESVGDAYHGARAGGVGGVTGLVKGAWEGVKGLFGAAKKGWESGRESGAADYAARFDRSVAALKNDAYKGGDQLLVKHLDAYIKEKAATPPPPPPPPPPPGGVSK